MQTFLNQPEATFYHITTINSWELIQKKRLISKDKQIFVSRVGELPILLAIALQQLPEIYCAKTKGIVFLKLTQRKNNFTTNEIRADNQANELTKQFQNIISRTEIPFKNIELMMILNLDFGEQQRECILMYLTKISEAAGLDYLNTSINQRAAEII